MTKLTKYTIELPDLRKLHLAIKKEGLLEFIYCISLLKNKFKNIQNQTLAETKLETHITKRSECIKFKSINFQKLNFLRKFNQKFIIQKNWGYKGKEMDFITFLPINKSRCWSIILNDKIEQSIGTLELVNQEALDLNRVFKLEERKIWPDISLNILLNQTLLEDVKVVILVTCCLVFKLILKDFMTEKRNKIDSYNVKA